MAKKMNSDSPSQPVVSDIPLPVSQNPLVIDLPDGQKLVIGKMESGAVIEVATWRGTGRPDSRTNRLMLGMSNAGDESAPKPDPAQKTSPNLSYSSTQKKEATQFKLPAISKNFMIPSFSDLVSRPVKMAKKLFEKSQELAPVETTTELNINQWIEQISQEAQSNLAKRQSRKNVQPTTPPSPEKKAK